jgi:hypothetical protein
MSGNCGHEMTGAAAIGTLALLERLDWLQGFRPPKNLEWFRGREDKVDGAETNPFNLFPIP